MFVLLEGKHWGMIDKWCFIGYYIGVYTTWFCRPMKQESLDISDLTIDRTESVAFVLHLPRASPQAPEKEARLQHGQWSWVQNRVQIQGRQNTRTASSWHKQCTWTGSSGSIYMMHLRQEGWTELKRTWIFFTEQRYVTSFLQSIPLASQVVAPKRVPKKRCDPDRSTPGSSRLFFSGKFTALSPMIFTDIWKSMIFTEKPMESSLTFFKPHDFYCFTENLWNFRLRFSEKKQSIDRKQTMGLPSDQRLILNTHVTHVSRHRGPYLYILS